jgi:hypothetical protein
MVISLTDAAKQAGISKPGLMKAIKKGKLSAEKNAHGQWVVDPAELLRVYPTQKPVAETVSGEVGVGITTENNALKREVDLLRQQLDRANLEKDRVLKMLEEQIVSVKQLTDQRQEKESKGLWQRLFG